MNYNQCTIIGRLVAEPELSHTQSGVSVCKMRVAVNRIQSAEARAQGAQAEADFFDVSAWRQSGEYAAQYLGKGRLVLVAGKMQLRDYLDKEGIKRKAFEIVADQVKGLDRAEGNGAGGENEFSQARRDQRIVPPRRTRAVGTVSTTRFPTTKSTTAQREAGVSIRKIAGVADGRGKQRPYNMRFAFVGWCKFDEWA